MKNLLLPAVLLVATETAGIDRAESQKLAELLHIGVGARVADVGAGRGEWSLDFARRVGPGGHVFATEVDPERLKEIRDAVSEQKLTNVSVIWGGPRDAGLPPACCDAILIREVYHHFTDPAAMQASLYRAIRPGGLVAVVDMEPGARGARPLGVPENRAGHGIPQKILIEEMTGAGFEVVTKHDDWPDRLYCVLFRRPVTS